MDVAPLALTRAGTARYLERLLAWLEREPSLDVRCYAFGGPARLLRPIRDLAWYPVGLGRRARRDGVDLLHCPTFRAPPSAPVPLVVTFHDLAVLRYPGAFNRWTRTYSRLLLPRVARAASRLIAVSELTRRELVELLGVPDDRIRVIPNGVDAPFTSGGPAADGDYVLAISTLEPRKNLPRLLEAFRRASLGGCELVVVGGSGWGGVRVEGSGVRWAREVGDEALARLYRGARCVAYVSLYEGFGLPVLEGMACGAAVVTSAGTAMEEVAGEAAVLVDPLDPDAIAAGLEEAVARRDELGARGRERARQFAWQETARATLEVYREVAG
jgi:glycosyltransferase involved in cell wall biosynthesis